MPHTPPPHSHPARPSINPRKRQASESLAPPRLAKHSRTSKAKDVLALWFGYGLDAWNLGRAAVAHILDGIHPFLLIRVLLIPSRFFRSAAFTPAIPSPYDSQDKTCNPHHFSLFRPSSFIPSPKFWFSSRIFSPSATTLAIMPRRHHIPFNHTSFNHDTSSFDRVIIL